MILGRRILLWITTSFLLLSGNIAHAWGHLKYLNTPSFKSFLVYSVQRTHQINFCVEIQDGDAGGFSYNSMSTQTQMALTYWLSPVANTVGNVSLNEVPCSNKNLNLMIEVGPFDDPRGSWEQPEFMNRMYSHVIINTSFRHIINGNSVPIFDFQELVDRLNSRNGGLLNLQDAIAKAAAEKVNAELFGDWDNLKTAAVIGSSYVDLLHELGHTFGLCDLDKANFYQSCDPNHVSSREWSEQPDSVMGDPRFFYLRDDDIAGIRSLFKRFAYLAKP